MARTTSLNVLLVLILLTGTKTLASIRKIELADPAVLFSKADVFFDDAVYDSALRYYAQAASLFHEKANWSGVASCTNSIAEIYRILGDNDNCAKYVQEALQICQNQIKVSHEALAKAHEVNGKLHDYNLRDFAQAQALYEKALAIRKTMFKTDHPSIAENLFLIGRTYLYTGRFDEARKYFNDAIAMKTKVSGEFDISLYDTHIGMAVLQRRLLQMDEALISYQKAQTVWKKNKKSETHPNYGLLLYGMGNLYLETGLYDDAIQNYSASLEIFRKAYGEKNFKIPVTLMNIGAAKGNQLDFYGAIHYYTKALALYNEIVEPGHPFISSLHIDFCDVYGKMGKYDLSIAHGKEAIAMLEKRYQEPNREMGIALYATSRALVRVKDHAQALPYIERAIAVFKSMDEAYLLSTAYTIRAEIMELQQNYIQAQKDFESAIATLGEKSVRNLHLAHSYGAYGEFCFNRKDFKKALTLTNKGLYQLGITLPDIYSTFPVESLYTVDFISSLLGVRSQALYALYQQTKDKKALHAALKNYALLAEVYQKIIRESKAERSKLLQLPNLAAYYEKAVVCALELFSVTKDASFKDQAFAMAEQSKAILLTQYIHDSKARQFAGIPAEVIAEERRLKEKISFTERQLSETSNDSLHNVYQQNQFVLRQRYDSLLDQLERQYPAYHALKYKRQEIQSRELMSLLGDNDAVVEYLTGEENIYAFVVTNESLDIVTIPNAQTIATQSENLRKAVIGKVPAQYQHAAFTLYRSVFEPVELLLKKGEVTAVTIIPDGYLSYIPFEALIKEQPSDERPHYLLQDYAFHYQYSAGLISQYRSMKKMNSTKTLIGFAPSFGEHTLVDAVGEEESLAPLAFAGEEVEFVASTFQGQSFLNDLATETNFKKYASDYRIIHLATHAIIDDETPDLSRLYFTPQSDSADDGRLYAYELFNMNIPASMVTLSACNTGAGVLHKGEGVMSLSRAFAYAGCPSIVTSLWQAQDQSTVTIMKYFYGKLNKGLNKAEALRLAKLQYLTEADKVKGMPFFWAGFILTGDELPARQSLARHWIAVIVLTLVGISLVVVKTVRRKRRLAAA